MNLQPEQPDRSETTGRGTPLSDELRQLERATANRLVIAADSDPPATNAETVAMRESWLALSHLLDSNTPSVDEAALVLQVRGRLGRQIKRRRWKVAALALAASLLLAVGVAWLASRSSHERARSNTNPIIVQTPPIRTPSIESPPAAPQDEPIEPVALDPTAIAENDAYWQDDLADDLAQAQQDLANVQANWARLPDPMAWMQFQMNEFEHELGENSL